MSMPSEYSVSDIRPVEQTKKQNHTPLVGRVLDWAKKTIGQIYAETVDEKTTQDGARLTIETVLKNGGDGQIRIKHRDWQGNIKVGTFNANWEKRPTGKTRKKKSQSGDID